MNELNLEDATQANINILREPEGGVFGVGGTKALVRISEEMVVPETTTTKIKEIMAIKRHKKQYTPKKPRIEADKDEQLKVSLNFLEGLVKSFGLDGKVEGTLEDEN